MPVVDSSSFTGRALQQRDTPKINGSEGGFIALIVCLSLIIVGSCCAIFYLLRHHEPSEAERAARRASRRYRNQTTHSRYSSAGQPTFLSKIFGRNGSGHHHEKSTSSTGSRLNMGRTSGQGWMQTGSGDEWDDDSGDELRRDRPVAEIPSEPVAYSAIRPPIKSYPSTDSASSVQFEAVVTPKPSMPNIHSQLTSPVSSSELTPARTSSPEPISGSGPNVSMSPVADREGRTQSGSSVRTFSGGTKFIEAL